MATVRVDPTRPDPAVIDAAARLIRSGALVAFPTETVYGLGAHALDGNAVGRIFEAKGRPSFNPVIVHIASAAGARDVVARWPPEADALAARYWPGPLTLVLPKLPSVPDIVTASLPNVAVRVPAHPVASALLSAAGVPIAAPSANRSAELSPTEARHVEKSLGDSVDMILDGGSTAVGIESAVLDLSSSTPMLLRPGTLSRDDLEAVIGPIEIPTRAFESGEARPAPGMLDRHYAPRAALLLYNPADEAEQKAASKHAREAVAAGSTVGALVIHESAPPGATRVLLMPKTPNEYARRLYAALHDLDDAGCSLIIVERVPTEAKWAAIADRLERAAR